MGSTRLPGKVLRQLCGRSVLHHVVSRVRAARRLNGMIVATTQASDDDAVAAECMRLKIQCFRGSEQDVLSRYFDAAQETGAEVVARVTADCPLFDGTLLDKMLKVFHNVNRMTVKVDYLSNA